MSTYRASNQVYTIRHLIQRGFLIFCDGPPGLILMSWEYGPAQIRIFQSLQILKDSQGLTWYPHSLPREGGVSGFAGRESGEGLPGPNQPVAGSGEKYETQHEE
jgi:hypothetical protein